MGQGVRDAVEDGQPHPPAGSLATVPNVAALAAGVIAGDRRAIARALSVVERADDVARELIGALFVRTGRAHLVGITGVGGVGKSSLISRLVAEWRRRGKRVAVVAVDPSSALTGGALLGDRVRMEELQGDSGVFLRSMATRGAAGGLARATTDAVRVFDAAGFEVVLIETIGVGQDELDIAQVAETVVVVEAPNLGDDVQSLKAGLTEIADVYAVNKADAGSADRTIAILRAMLAIEGHDRDWTPPLVKTSAATGEGIAELADAVESHLAWLDSDGGKGRAEQARVRARSELSRLVRDAVVAEILRRAGDPDLADASAAVASREQDPYAAARAILRRANTLPS